MRVSTDPKDGGYTYKPQHYKVFFNGVQTKYVFTADEEKGFIDVAILDKNGKMQLSEGKVLSEFKYGNVRVEYDPQ